jgi:hypothetical protein
MKELTIPKISQLGNESWDENDMTDTYSYSYEKRDLDDTLKSTII